jgi:deferrochelatase/peroxidase EfeB
VLLVVEDLCDGDIVIQACADDPQVAVHAVRNLTRAGSGVVEVRWSQLGYGAASKTTQDEDTPRNLFGFKDGTRNITADETGDIESNVWVGDDPDSAGPGGWMTGGVYMCTRRIRMLLEVWDRQVLDDQQHTFARYKGSGAPIGAEKEDDDVPFDLYLGTGGPAIPHDSHVYLAHPDQNNGRRMLRRAYNFIEGSDSFGHLSAGLFFIAYVTKPSENFTPIQLKLAHDDKMNEYVRYESKAVFACPPGLGDGDDWGTALFG